MFLYLLPIELRIDGFYEIAVNLSILLALGAFVLHLPSNRQPVVWNLVCNLVALYMAWGIVSLLWAPDIVQGRRKLVAYGLGLILLFLTSNQVRTFRDLDKFMRVLAMIGWILIIAGLITAFFGNYQYGDRLKVLGENENILGLILMMMLPGTIWPVLRSSGPKRSLLMALSVVYILLTLVLVVLSGSRGSTISMILVLSLFSLSRPLRPWSLVVGVLAVGIIMAAPFLLNTIVERFEEQDSADIGGRTIFWQASLLLIKDYPMTGVGIGNGPLVLIEYVRALTSDYNYRSALVSHSSLFEVGIDTGIVGMCIYLGVCVAAVGSLARSRSRMKGVAPSAYLTIVMSIAAGYFTSSIKSGGLETHPIFFVLLSLLVIPSTLSANFGAAVDKDPDGITRSEACVPGGV
jgi:O-antigen ligase